MGSISRETGISTQSSHAEKAATVPPSIAHRNSVEAEPLSNTAVPGTLKDQKRGELPYALRSADVLALQRIVGNQAVQRMIKLELRPSKDIIRHGQQSGIRTPPMIQRKFKVALAKDHFDTITDIKVQDRPFIKERLDALDTAILQKPANQQYYVDGQLREGYVRGHIIGWNILWRNYVAGLGLPRSLADLCGRLNITDEITEERLIRQIRFDLTNIFYNPQNYVITSAAAEQGDRDALREAGQQAVQGATPTLRFEALRAVFTLSFNVGLSGEGTNKAADYIRTFAQAYNIPEATLQDWPLRDHTGQQRRARELIPRAEPIHVETGHRAQPAVPMQVETQHLSQIVPRLGEIRALVGQLWQAGNRAGLLHLRAQLATQPQFTEVVADIDVLLRPTNPQAPNRLF